MNFYNQRAVERKAEPNRAGTWHRPSTLFVSLPAMSQRFAQVYDDEDENLSGFRGNEDTGSLWLGTSVWKEPKSFRSVVKESLGVQTTINGSLSPRHGASSGCGWRNGFQIWRVTANILNTQSRAADREWSLGVGLGTNNCSPWKRNMLRNISQVHVFGLILWYVTSYGRETRDSSPGMWGVCLDRGGKSLERVKQFKYCEQHQQIKISFMKKLRADWNQGMLAIIRCRICRLPACYPKI